MEITTNTPGGFQAASPFRDRAAANETILQCEVMREDAACELTGNATMFAAMTAAVDTARGEFVRAMLQIAADAEAGATHPAIIEGIAACTPLREEEIATIQGEAIMLRDMLP